MCLAVDGENSSLHKTKGSPAKKLQTSVPRGLQDGSVNQSQIEPQEMAETSSDESSGQPTPRLRKLQGELEAYYLKMKGKVHAFALLWYGKVLTTPGTPLDGLVKAGMVVEKHRVWKMVCLECGRLIPTKRWKQYREWPCRRPVSAAKWTRNCTDCAGVLECLVQENVFSGKRLKNRSSCKEAFIGPPVECLLSPEVVVTLKILGGMRWAMPI